jgi:hypothetical protein
VYDLPVNKSLRRLLIPTGGVIALLAIGCVLSQTRNVAPPFRVPPLPANAPQLTAAEVEKILRANFEVIYRVQQLPAAVKEDYAAVTHQTFRMVNTGEPVSTDAIIPGVPNKQLLLAGVSDQNAVLIYKVFGFTSKVQVMVFSHQEKTGVWTATIEDHTVNDLAELRSALQKGQLDKK